MKEIWKKLFTKVYFAPNPTVWPFSAVVVAAYPFSFKSEFIVCEMIIKARTMKKLMSKYHPELS